VGDIVGVRNCDGQNQNYGQQQPQQNAENGRRVRLRWADLCQSAHEESLIVFHGLQPCLTLKMNFIFKMPGDILNP
jgi:hypothetical protein